MIHTKARLAELIAMEDPSIMDPPEWVELCQSVLAELERLEADKVRLDWLEKREATVMVFFGNPKWMVLEKTDRLGQGDTLRDAIDAARTTESEADHE